MKKYLIGLTLLACSPVFAATYEKQDFDYGHKLIHLVKFEIKNKMSTVNTTYKEGYLVYTETPMGTEHKAVCVAKFCDSLLKSKAKFKAFENKRANVKTDTRLMDDGNTFEEIIMDLKIIKD